MKGRNILVVGIALFVLAVAIQLGSEWLASVRVPPELTSEPSKVLYTVDRDWQKVWIGIGQDLAVLGIVLTSIGAFRLSAQRPGATPD